MRKFKFLMAMAITFMLTLALDVNASEVTVVDQDGLKACFADNNDCKLDADIVLNETRIGTSKEVILDLNGHSITPDSSLSNNGGLLYSNGGKLIINDTSSSKTGKISGGNNFYAGIQVAADSDLIINGGTIEGFYYGIVGNGNQHKTFIEVNDGIIQTIEQNDSTGIYHPQIGSLIINGGKISGGTGIEIRSGDLTVNGGIIKATASTLVKNPNSNGTTTQGAGIAVAQHTTNNDLVTLVYGGNIEGIVALLEHSPEIGTDTNKVAVNIIGGVLKTTEVDGEAVQTEDNNILIFGGKFNSDVSAYVDSNYELDENGNVVGKTEEPKSEEPKKETTDKVAKENPNTSDGLITYISLLLVGGVSVLGSYKKYIEQ